MRTLSAGALSVVLACLAWSQQPSATTPQKPGTAASNPARLTEMFRAKVTAEWDAFKKKDKQAYSNLLADDFIGIEDDGEGTRKKTTAVAEIDKSVIHDYKLFAL